jgi:hypothetical protein
MGASQGTESMAWWMGSQGNGEATRCALFRRKQEYLLKVAFAESTWGLSMLFDKQP